MNYAATVVQLNKIRPHNGADRLSCTNIFGNNVIVGLAAKEGDIGLFFPLESQLGEQFATVNDLIRRKDENGKPAGGMFDSNRRVRAQKFRGEKSMGFFAPIEYLHKAFDAEGKSMPVVNVGDEFEELDGIKISTKYVISSRMHSTKQGNGSSKKKQESRLVENQFHFHFDTAHFGKNIHRFTQDSLVAVTWKFHGTSGVVGNVMCKKPLKLHEKILKAIGVNIVDTEYDYIYSSRKVIKNDYKESNGFYDSDVWTLAGNKFEGLLHKGEQVYYELVGYTPSGSEIQKGYDYNCMPKMFEIYIYRITQTNVDGVVTELPWHQVKHRSKELGFNTVPEIYYGPAGKQFGHNYKKDETWREFYLKTLGENYVNDQDSIFCQNKVPEEGIVIRLETGEGIENFKFKSFTFLNYESKMLDSGEADMESVESE